MSNPKSIRSLRPYEAEMRRLGEFRVVAVSENLTESAKSLGFTVPLVSGEALMPPPHGPFADFNANGREVIRKDLPKVNRSFSMWSEWKDWHGNWHSGSRYVDRKVYQREFIDPPSEYLTVFDGKDGQVIASRALSLSDETAPEVIHTINLMLESFGGFEISSADISTVAHARVKVLNWKILPAGKYPFERARRELSDYLKSLPDASRPLVEERIEKITRYSPDFLAVGVGGFSDYVVFGFTDRDVFVLESHRLGNATYVLKRNWEAVAKLTKKEILDGSLHEARLIHNHRWHGALHGAIARRAT